MNFIAKIKSHFFRKKWKEQLQQRRSLDRLEAIHPQRAQCLAILFIADNADDRQAVEAYRQARKKEGLRTELLGFFSKEVNEAGYSFDQFSSADTNWFGVPKGRGVEKFLARPCDLLFTLGAADHPQLDYLASLKSTKLRVGPHSEQSSNPHDIQFFIPKNGMSIAEQIRQINQIFKVTNVSELSIAV